MAKPIQVEGIDYFVNVTVKRGSTHTSNVNLAVELYDEEPTFTNGEASIAPVRTIEVSGDLATLYEQFERALELLNLTRTW